MRLFYDRKYVAMVEYNNVDLKYRIIKRKKKSIHRRDIKRILHIMYNLYNSFLIIIKIVVTWLLLNNKRIL